jgi:arsenite methyltransferase
MVISDLVTDKWCSCIDGALTKENYIASIREEGFEKVEVLDEKLYIKGDQVDNRKITSLVIKAVKE